MSQPVPTSDPVPKKVIRQVTEVVTTALASGLINRAPARGLLEAVGFEPGHALEMIWTIEEGPFQSD